jgi:cytochrome c6
MFETKGERNMKFSIKEVKLAVTSMLLIGSVWSLAGGSPSATGTLVGDGAATYKAKCASCHAADGSGNTPAGKSLNVRDLRSADVQKQSDDQLYSIIANGKGKMPGYEKTLGAASCKELAAQIRHLAGK